MFYYDDISLHIDTGAVSHKSRSPPQEVIKTRRNFSTSQTQFQAHSDLFHPPFTESRRFKRRNKTLW